MRKIHSDIELEQINISDSLKKAVVSIDTEKQHREDMEDQQLWDVGHLNKWLGLGWLGGDDNEV